MAVENILSDFLLWGRQYGRKDTGEVRRAADAAIFIALCSWVVITVLCLLFVKRYFVWQSGRDGVIAKYGIQYLAVCMLFSLVQWVFDRFVIASGRIAQQAGKCGSAVDGIYACGFLGLPLAVWFWKKSCRQIQGGKYE